MLKQGLPPIAGESTRLLVLGSLPGERSLQQGQYYAHWTNQFWKLIGTVVGEDLDGLEYEARLDVLREHGIGLWDVVSAAEREGSGDDAIRDATHNDLGGLKRTYPQLQAIAFNGGRAAEDGFRLLAGVEGLSLHALPSSSARNARMTFAEKARSWAVLRQFLPR